jgi:hypothetical protein
MFGADFIAARAGRRRNGVGKSWRTIIQILGVKATATGAAIAEMILPTGI